MATRNAPRNGVADAVKDCVPSDHPHKGLDVHDDLRAAEDHEAKPLAARRLEERPRA
jgi:hypothetical protein